MDALYILGTGSKYNNLELMYSLRSLERYGSNIGNVVLIGEKPSFLDYNVIKHYPFREFGNKDFRIAAKIVYACNTRIVSDDFLFLNDDFFFTSTFDAKTYPYYQKGELLIGEPKTEYQKLLQHTRDYLLSKGKSTTHFDVHTPIIYNRQKFIDLMKCWEYSGKTAGLSVKSTYCNMHGITGPMYDDVKVREWGIDEYKRAMSVNCFSCYDVIPHSLTEWLSKSFPNKSKFEL